MPTNIAIRKYLNDNNVPDVFVAAGRTYGGDYQHYPWSIGLLPSYRVEATISSGSNSPTRLEGSPM